MNRKDSIAFLKGKTLKELLELLNLGQTGELNITPDFLNEIIQELNSRGLSDKEIREPERILNPSVNKDSDQSIVNNEEMPKETMAEPQMVKDKEPNKYETLKVFCGILAFMGYVIICVSLCFFVNYLGKYQYMECIIYLAAGLVIALPLLAFTNLIHVFIDIESNTRKLLKTKE